MPKNNKDYSFSPVTDHYALEKLLGTPLSDNQAFDIVDLAEKIFREDLDGDEKIEKAFLLAFKYYRLGRKGR